MVFGLGRLPSPRTNITAAVFYTRSVDFERDNCVIVGYTVNASFHHICFNNFIDR